MTSVRIRAARTRGILVLAFALTAVSCFASCPLDEQTVDAIRVLVDAHIEADPAPGLVLAVRCGDTYWIEAFGLSVIKTQEPMDSSLQFFVGSISQQFVAASILKLREAGLLELDDPISDYIDHVPDDWSAITIRHLLTHTSGANSFGGYNELPVGIGFVYPSETIIQSMMLGPLFFTPGEEFLFGRTTGYAVLAYVAECVTGETIESYIEREFLTPLGLLDTWFATIRHPENMAGFYHHYWDGHAMFEELPVFDMGLGSAMYSTATDLLAWQIALSTGRVIAEESYALMTEQATTRNAEGVIETHDYGLGLEVYVSEDGEIAKLGHFGDGGGHRCGLWAYPPADVVVVLLQNSDRQLDPLLEDIEAVLFQSGASD